MKLDSLTFVVGGIELGSACAVANSSEGDFDGVQPKREMEREGVEAR